MIIINIRSAYLKLVGNPSGLPDPNSSYQFNNDNSFDGNMYDFVNPVSKPTDKVKRVSIKFDNYKNNFS